MPRLYNSKLKPIAQLSTATVSSTSTNETADNLAGAGRTVGLLYKFLGTKLETQLGRIADVHRRGSSPTSDQRNNGNENENDHFSTELSTISSNATDDNLVGPGRTLGLLFSFLGHKIEAHLSHVALRQGLGPNAAFDRIQSRMEVEQKKQYIHWWDNEEILDFNSYRSMQFKESVVPKTLLKKGQVLSDLQRLLKYAQ